MNTGIGTMNRYQPGLLENITFFPTGILNILRPQLPAPILMFSSIIIGIIIVDVFSKKYFRFK